MTVIAIDGPAGSGKSTVARCLAERLDLDHLDTGAMYRAVAFLILRLNICPDDVGQVSAIAQSIDLNLEAGRCWVNGIDVSSEIRGLEVTKVVSTVAAIPQVRAEMVNQQRAWVDERGGGVVEGRDIGSVVFPKADIKVFLTATPEIRAERRFIQSEITNVEETAADIKRRDEADSARITSPLVRADGAVEIDTSKLEVEEIVDQILKFLE